MTLSPANLIKQLAPLITCALLSGCGTTPQTHHYVLSSHSAAAATIPARSRVNGTLVDGVTLGVGPITVADYLNRSQIALIAGNELRLEPFHNWGEPLDTGISRVLYENLSSTLGARHLVQFPWRSDEIPALQLRVHVSELNRAGGLARLRANWVLAARAPGAASYRDAFEAEVPVGDDGFDTLAAAYSTLLRQLADRISRRVQSAAKAMADQ